MPKFSVVIAAFNAERTIHSAIDSALGQSYDDLEVIVVDDGSTDDTAAVARGVDHERVRVLTQSNRGPAAARNTAIAAATGEYVAILDSDDLWLPDYLDLADRALSEVPNAGFAYSDAYAFDAATGRVRRQTAMERMRPPTPPPPREEFLNELLTRNFIHISATIPTAVLKAVGGLDERRFGTEDYDLWLRIIAAGYEPVLIPGQHALYRLHAAQISTDSSRRLTELASMFADLAAEQPLSPRQREIADRRRRGAERGLRAVAGEAAVGSRIRALRTRLGRVRNRLGLADRWYGTPPAEVSAAYPDLRSV